MTNQHPICKLVDTKVIVRSDDVEIGASWRVEGILKNLNPNTSFALLFGIETENATVRFDENDIVGIAEYSENKTIIYLK